MDALVRVWTIQRPEWLETLQREGSIRGDARYVWEGFHESYRWMMQQMAERLENYEGGYPIWVWRAPKPDLRRTAHLPKRTAGVRVELEIPQHRLLLSDFESWHCVLNGWGVPLSEEESDGWDQLGRQSKRDRRAEVRESWKRVFDFDALAKSPLWGPVDRIQGVVERVHAHEVRRVTRFIAR